MMRNHDNDIKELIAFKIDDTSDDIEIDLNLLLINANQKQNLAARINDTTSYTKFRELEGRLSTAGFSLQFRLPFDGRSAFTGPSKDELVLYANECGIVAKMESFYGAYSGLTNSGIIFYCNCMTDNGIAGYTFLCHDFLNYYIEQLSKLKLIAPWKISPKPEFINYMEAKNKQLDSKSITKARILQSGTLLQKICACCL